MTNRQLLLQEFWKPDLADEAQALAVFFGRRGKSCLFSQLPHVRLLHVANRKHGLGKLFLIELAQEVALVFVGVRTGHQSIRLAFTTHPLAIVARRHSLCAKLLGRLEEEVKLDLAVAEHVRIGGPPLAVLVKHVIDDADLVLGAEVHDLEWDAQMVGHQHGVVGVVDPRTFVVDRDALVVPIPHEQADHFVALLHQKMRSHA